MATSHGVLQRNCVCPQVMVYVLQHHWSHSTIILPVVLYGSEILSLTVREEHSLRVFENRVLSRMFRAKKDKVTADWTETTHCRAP